MPDLFQSRGLRAGLRGQIEIYERTGGKIKNYLCILFGVFHEYA